jgi:hypothetical protein
MLLNMKSVLILRPPPVCECEVDHSNAGFRLHWLRGRERPGRPRAQIIFMPSDFGGVTSLAEPVDGIDARLTPARVQGGGSSYSRAWPRPVSVLPHREVGAAFDADGLEAGKPEPNVRYGRPHLCVGFNKLILQEKSWRPDLDLNQAMRPCTVPASPLRHRAAARIGTGVRTNKVNGLG